MAGVGRWRVVVKQSPWLTRERGHVQVSWPGDTMPVQKRSAAKLTLWTWLLSRLTSRNPVSRAVRITVVEREAYCRIRSCKFCSYPSSPEGLWIKQCEYILESISSSAKTQCVEECMLYIYLWLWCQLIGSVHKMKTCQCPEQPTRWWNHNQVTNYHQ